MNKFSIICLSLLLTWQGSTFAQALTRPALSDKKVQSFIGTMVKKHQFNRHDLEQLFANIEFKIWTKDNIVPKKRNPKPAPNWSHYQRIFLTHRRINNGILFWQKYQQVLIDASKKFAVPVQIIVAILGIETNYGLNKGKHPTLQTLTRKAFNGYRRAKFYQKELEHFLLLTQANNLAPLSITGSHAGAMGYAQFIASSYRYYAIDFDQDNKVDLFHSPADAIGSIANYFARHHWQKDAPIATQLKQLDKALQAQGHQRPIRPKTSLKTWRTKGLNLPSSIPLQQKAEIIKLITDHQPEYWLAFKNFYILTRYNHSNLYAMVAYQLSEVLLTRMRKGSAIAEIKPLKK